MKDLINSIYRLKDEDYKVLLNISKAKKFKKGEYILSEGDTCRGIYYVNKGIIGLYKTFRDRAYYQEFFMEKTFATNIVSLTSNAPSEECLIALEETDCTYISKVSLISLYNESSEFKEFGRLLLEQILAQKAKLSFIRSSLPAKEKYEFILSKYPHYIQRIPLQLLASYLGMTRETLSRMRR